MNCSKCGNLNNENARFCVKCGNVLGTPVPNTTPIMNEQQNNFITQPQNINNVQMSVAPQVVTSQSSKPILNFVKYIINSLIRPIKTFKDEEDKLSDVKNSFILTGIVAFAMMFVNLITAIINTIVVKDYNYELSKIQTSIKFEYLEKLDFVSLIFKNLLINIIIILVIAGVYYLASLVAKKTTNFSKMLAATATAVLPNIILCSILAPIISKLWADLYIIIFIVGLIYSFVMFICLMNENTKFENGDINIYYHLASMSILAIIGYFVIMNSLSSIGLGEIMSMIN